MAQELSVSPHSLESISSAEAPKHALHLDIQVLFLSQVTDFAYQFQQVLKRMADMMLALAALVVFSPLLTAIALLIKLTSPGPVFYLSERVGKNYNRFRMVKFRTMTTDADSQRDRLRESTAQQGKLFKMRDDPRVTPLGRLLRKTSLDELPQLFNVVRGEMSLVGPRPLPPDESFLFDAPYTLRYRVFPGITGAWQVHGRSNTDFENLCRLEMDYLMNWTLKKDAELILKTIPAVLTSRGAY